MKDNKSQEWTGRTDGAPWMLRSLVWLLKRLPLQVMYGFVDVLVVFYWLFSRKGRRVQYNLFRQRLGKTRWQAVGGSYQNMRQFGRAILDRFAVYAGKQFHITIQNKEWVEQCCRTELPLVILTGHVGNFELAGYFVHPADKKMQVLLYSGEKEEVLKNRAKFFAANNISLLFALPDMSYLFEIKQTLAAGQVLGIFADRLFGSQRTLCASVLGKEADLPLGPFKTALLYEANKCAMFAMKTGKQNYEIRLTPLQGNTPQELALEYARALETVVREYPTQWYNYFEFWK